MRLDVYFGPSTFSSAEVQGRVAVVIDVLRASTTIAVALANGARNVVPCESAEEAITRARSFERASTLVAGERRMQRVAGFDLGNSPGEFDPSTVSGKSILLNTSNGTAALLAVHAARDVLVGSYVNFSAVLGAVRALRRTGRDVALICAGTDRQFSLEDAACAGRFVRALTRRGDVELNDAARVAGLVERRFRADLTALFAEASHARALVTAGFERDVAQCATLDSHSVVPVFAERKVTLRTGRRGDS